MMRNDLTVGSFVVANRDYAAICGGTIRDGELYRVTSCAVQQNGVSVCCVESLCNPRVPRGVQGRYGHVSIFAQDLFDVYSKMQPWTDKPAYYIIERLATGVSKGAIVWASCLYPSREIADIMLKRVAQLGCPDLYYEVVSKISECTAIQQLELHIRELKEVSGE